MKSLEVMAFIAAIRKPPRSPIAQVIRREGGTRPENVGRRAACIGPNGCRRTKATLATVRVRPVVRTGQAGSSCCRRSSRRHLGRWFLHSSWVVSRMSFVIHLDYNGTTPILPEVLEAMMPYLTTGWSRSVKACHRERCEGSGAKPRSVIETAREQVAGDNS